MASRNYSDLIAWQKATDLAEAVYEATKSFPKEEIYCITSQMRRAAISVPSNIAEGQGRRARREFVRFLAIAHGSLRELETQIILSARFRYMSSTEKEGLLTRASQVGRLITGLAKSMTTDE